MTGHERIIMEEVCSSIWRLKKGKAPGICGVTGEMLKASGRVVVQWLHKVIDLTWRSGSVPMDWQKSVIVPVHKKGSRTNCENYRGISLLSIPCKVYASILETRMRTITEGKSVGRAGGILEGKELCRPVVYCQAVNREDH